MIVQIKRIVLLLWIFFHPVSTLLSQHLSKNNYTGYWNTPTSWSPTWATPQTNISSYNITINGYITVSGSLSFTITSDLIINDTLVINGDLLFENYCDLTINNNAILIVRGNVSFHNHCNIIANGSFIVTGNIDKNGSINEGSITSNDDPVKVFIGGTVSPATLVNNQTDYPALDCTTHPTIPYTNSTCSYGNMTDLINDPLYLFFQSTCVIANAGNNGPLCAGNNINLTSSGGIGYSWSGPNGFTSNLQNPSLLDVDTSMAGGYIVTVTAITGCMVNDTTHVNVFALPAIPIVTVGGKTTFCIGDSVYLASSTATSYLWSNAATTASINVTTSGSYSVKVTNANGCQSAVSATTVVLVNALPAIPIITASGITSFCDGGNVLLTSSTGTSYLWSNAATTATINSITSGGYTVKVTDVNGCQSGTSAATVVTVNSLPIITIGSNSPVCEVNTIHLTSSVNTGYSWSGPNSFSSTEQNPSIINAERIMTGIYKVTVTATNACKKSDSITVIVNPLPLVTISSSSDALCVNDSRTLTGIPNGGTFIVLAGQGIINGDVLSTTSIGNINLKYSYTNLCANKDTQFIIVNANPIAIPGPDQELKFVIETKMKATLSSSETGEWSLVSGSGTFSDIHSPTTSVVDLTSGENIFLWKVKNGNCEANAKVTITVDALFIPSAITPNGDGKNDCFKIGEVDGHVELFVFNSWGNIEYTNSNYLNDWEGRNNKGLELPNDTYFYVLKFENSKIKKGAVLIKR